MRRFVLAALTATALLSGSLPAWAEDSASTPPTASAPAAEPTAGPTPDPALPDLVGVDPVDLLRGAPDDTAPVTAEARAQAKDALTTVKQIFAPAPSTSSPETAPAPATGPDATMALRDLSLRLNALSRADRNSALAMSQRPWDDTTAGATQQCTDNICLHWATSSTATGNQADVTDPNWARNTVLPVLAHVSATYQQAGYDKPKADGPINTNPYSPYAGQPVQWGGTPQTDVYLADLGGSTSGLYGYCAYDQGDDGRIEYTTARSDVPAFCVLDNDFSLSQYRPTYAGETPTDILKVTAAHEYFHAVQFAYDALEDAWFMEATATWAEHQLYPEIPDNKQFLPYSPLRFPQVSLDTFGGASGSLQYGDWIFFEYLTERIGYRTGPLPDLVLRMWKYADSRGADQYSTEAIASALASRGQKFAAWFTAFAAANRRPARTYQGGAAYPVAVPRRTVVVGAHKKRSGNLRIDHLAAMTVRMKPHKIRSKRKATIRVNMANRKYGSAAVVTVFLRNGQQRVRTVKLNTKGDGKVSVAFSNRSVAWVELTLVNANRSYAGCSANRAGYSCGGRPIHDNLKESWSLSS